MDLNRPLIFKTLGLLWIMLGISMLLPLGVALFYGDGAFKAFLVSAVAILVCGMILFLGFRSSSPQLRKRGAFFLVTVTWLSATVLGALPFYLSGYFPSIIDAWFESASGFTTTGASVLRDVESLPHALIFWRSFIQFLGGMGMIVLSLAVLPILGVGGMDLYSAEAPGPVSSKIGARVGQTARALWLVYLTFAIIQACFLWLFGMSFFDAMNHAFTTMATGGFSTKNNGVAFYDSAAIDAVITLFMFLAGMSFVLHFKLLVERSNAIFCDIEARFYCFVCLLSTLLVSIVLIRDHYPSYATAFRYASFQVVSIVSTTGFATADYLVWGGFVQALLVLLMVIGGCAGSTSGGIKCVRAMLLVKQGLRELSRMIHPKAVIPLKLGNRAVPSGVSSAVFGFFFLYMLLLGVSALVLCFCGLDMTTAFSAVVSSLSNIGPGLGEVGPALNYGNLPDVAKVVLVSCMIVGRLEIMTVLVLFTGEYWRN